MAFILADEATAHAQLALVALTKEIDLQGSTSFLTARHVASAVGLLRSKLDINPDWPEDALVGATALLTIVEVSLAYHRLCQCGSIECLSY